MSFGLHNKFGHVQHLASVQGMNDLLNFLMRTVPRGPLKDFVHTGITNDIDGVIKDIDQYLPYCTNPSVKATLNNMKDGLSKIQGTAVISD